MARGTPVARLSIEMVAEIARLQQDLDKAKKAVAAASGDISKSARAANDNVAMMGKGFTTAGVSAKQAAFGMRNLGFQVQDLGVQMAQAAGSSDPLRMGLMALVMQGPQIKDAIDQTGKSLTGLIAGFLRAHPILTAFGIVVGGLVGAMKLFQAQINRSGELDAYSRSLGLTAEEMKKLEGVGVTTTDVLKGLWRTIDSYLGLSTVFAAIKQWAVDAFGTAINWAKAFAAGTYAAIAGTANAVMALGRAAKLAIGGDFAGALTSLVKDDPLGGFTKAFKDASKSIDGFFADVGKNSIAAAKERISEQAKTLINARSKDAMKKNAEDTGKFLGEVLSGAFLARFTQELQNNPIVKASDIFQGQPTDLRGQVQDMEAVREGEQRLREAQDYMDLRSRDRFVEAADMLSDAIGGSFGRAISDLARVLDQRFPEFTKNIGAALDSFAPGLGAAISNAFAGAQVGAATADLMKSLGIKTSSTGAQVGGAVGSVFGPVGTIAGSIIGGVVGGLFKSVKKASATIEIMAGKAATASISGNSAKLRAVAGQMADSLIGGLSSIADQLGGMLGNGVRISIGQRKGTFRVDTAGLGRTKNMPSFETEAEAVAYALQAAIQQGAITGLRKGTETLIKAGGDLEAQLSKALAFEQVFKDLAAAANPARSSMEAITKEFEGLIDIFAEAGASAEDYAQLQQLLAIKQKQVIEEAFEPVAALLDELKASADSAGEALKTAFQDVLSREADAIAAYADAVERQQEAARAAQKAGIQSTIDSLRDGIATLQDQANAFAQAAERLRDFAETITVRSLGQLRQQFDRIATAARRGDLSAMEALPDAGRAYADAASANATDAVSLAREMARIRSATAGAIGAADAGKSAAERQIAAMTRQVELAQAQLDALDASSETLLSVDEALANMQSAKAAADEARAQMALLSELTETQTSFADAVKAYEAAKAARDDLLRQITAAGFGDLLNAQKKTGTELIAAVTEVAGMASAAQASAAAAIARAQAAQAAQLAANDNIRALLAGLNIPGFAAGGMHGGGLRIVGENGPEMEVTGPARIWTAGQIAAAGGGDNGELAREIRALREENRRYMFQLAKNTGVTADLMRQWDGDGQPETRTVA